MREQIGWNGRPAMALLLLVGLDLLLSLPIMGATYRPFSWMSIAPADATTLYPVIQERPSPGGDAGPPAIQELSFRGDNACVSVEAAPGVSCFLQRNTNLVDEAGWTDVAWSTSTGGVMMLIDTNPVSRLVFYRVKQLLAETP